ncbi:MAG: DotA/TraY family protein [Alphaproteobacteria bacterium]|nr:DotA/TraY family protein [Alphaproteobacteria bacterium]
MVGIKVPKGFFSYIATPQIGIRVKRLFLSGFQNFAYYLAAIYQLVGLLPRNHPYMRAENLGRFGISNVVFEAWRNVQFDKKNIDKVIVFFVVLVGIFILIVQLISLAFFLSMHSVFAATLTNPPPPALPGGWTGFFTVNDTGIPGLPGLPGLPIGVTLRNQDLAFIMLDLVFGVPYPLFSIFSTDMYGFFESCVSSVGSFLVPCLDNMALQRDIPPGTVVSSDFGPLAPGGSGNFPFPYHLGLHALFRIYNTGLLAVGIFIAMYFIMVVLAETAQSGTPFGRRFNKVWAPIRIVVAFGLLIPGSIGLNTSQYIVLYMAKYGSGFATNGWNYFAGGLGFTLAEEPEDFVSVPNIPQFDELNQFMHVVRACRFVQDFYTLRKYKQDNPGNAAIAALTQPPIGMRVHAYALFDPVVPYDPAAMVYRIDSSTVILSDVVTSMPDTSVKQLTIRFGIQDRDKYPEERNYVYPSCGEVNLPIVHAYNLSLGAIAIYNPGRVLMQEMYFQYIVRMWDNILMQGVGGGGIYVPTVIDFARRDYEVAFRMTKGLEDLLPTLASQNQVPLNNQYVQNTLDRVRLAIETAVGAVIAAQSNAVSFTGLDPYLILLRARGWAGAGIWYNKIAELNGEVTASVYNTPSISKYPAIMEQVREIKIKSDVDVVGGEQFNPEDSIKGSIRLQLGGDEGAEFAKTLYTAHAEWGAGVPGKQAITGNPFEDFITRIFGLNGLYDLRDNSGTHPLAMVVGIGRSLVESSVKALGYSAFGTIANRVGIPGGNVFASFAISMAMLGLTVGFVLFYIVPFLPFIYFFFAFGGWIKGIFEAMVAAPLWALAHIRIDGEGLPGSAAMNGYFLILEVFLRPILIVFGLLASITIFSALVDVLHSVYPILTQNAGGFDWDAELNAGIGSKMFQFFRSRVDQFFFTVMYAILVYLIGTASFKLVDTIPNNILRWMGISVATFGDQAEDPTAGLVGKASMGSQQATSKLGGGLQAISGALGGK